MKTFGKKDGDMEALTTVKEAEETKKRHLSSSPDDVIKTTVGEIKEGAQQDREVSKGKRIAERLKKGGVLNGKSEEVNALIREFSDNTRFSLEARELSKSYKENFSDAVIEERRGETFDTCHLGVKGRLTREEIYDDLFDVDERQEETVEPTIQSADMKDDQIMQTAIAMIKKVRCEKEAGDKPVTLQDIMQEIGEETRQCGLTPEILAEILGAEIEDVL